MWAWPWWEPPFTSQLRHSLAHDPRQAGPQEQRFLHREGSMTGSRVRALVSTEWNALPVFFFSQIQWYFQKVMENRTKKIIAALFGC